jgi:hypothetical protein
MTAQDAAAITRAVWEPRRYEMIDWLIKEKRFNPNAAPKAIEAFIATMVYVAEETGEPQIGAFKA